MRDSGVLKALVGVNVLIVDANATTRELLDSVLTYCGAFVSHAASTSEALDTVGSRRPDVVVIELILPGKEAYSLVRRLRAMESMRIIPIVALTSGRDHTASQTSSAGFDAHVRKPMDPWELCRILAGLTRKP